MRFDEFLIVKEIVSIINENLDENDVEKIAKYISSKIPQVNARDLGNLFGAVSKRLAPNNRIDSYFLSDIFNSLSEKAGKKSRFQSTRETGDITSVEQLKNVLNPYSNTQFNMNVARSTNLRLKNQYGASAIKELAKITRQNLDELSKISPNNSKDKARIEQSLAISNWILNGLLKEPENKDTETSNNNFSTLDRLQAKEQASGVPWITMFVHAILDLFRLTGSPRYTLENGRSNYNQVLADLQSGVIHYSKQNINKALAYLSRDYGTLTYEQLMKVLPLFKTANTTFSPEMINKIKPEESQQMPMRNAALSGNPEGTARIK